MIVQKKIFTENECREILKLTMDNYQSMKSFDRKYQSKSILYNKKNEWIFNKLSQFFEEETQYRILKVKKEIHFHTYNKNDWFGIHNDTRDGRIFSVGVLLNDNFTEGNFILYNPDEYRISKETGNAYIFDVKIDHEITQIMSGERHSLIWFLQKEHLDLKTDKLI